MLLFDRSSNTEKGAPDHGRSSNPRQGAYRTAPGRRPNSWGARSKHCFCKYKGPSAQVAGIGGSRNLTLARRSGYFLAAFTWPHGSSVYLVIGAVARPGYNRHHSRNPANVNNRDGRIGGLFWGVHGLVVALDVANICRDGMKDARSRAFPPKAVIGPCFSTGSRYAIVFVSVTPVHGRPAWRHGNRKPVNGLDNPTTSSSLEPDVNVGPNTACGGKGRKRPSQSRSVNLCVTTRAAPL